MPGRSRVAQKGRRMKCGNCKDDHETVAQVRECYGQPSGFADLRLVPVRLPEGLYATPSLTGNNDLDFWRVKHGRKPWVTFVNRVVGGHQDVTIPSDSKARIQTERIGRVTQQAAEQAIRDFGIEKSHELAGIELKFCRECGIHLTDEISRELGIGPVCRSKLWTG